MTRETFELRDLLPREAQRELLERLVALLMEAEISAQIDAGHDEPTDSRAAYPELAALGISLVPDTIEIPTQDLIPSFLIDRPKFASSQLELLVWDELTVL